MAVVIAWLEAAFAEVPLSILEVWGQFAYLIGFGLAILAFGGFTFRADGRLGLGRERQAWDIRAFLCIPLTFIVIVTSGYLGSVMVLVPGAQTFESLKDLAVFLSITLFGFPALIAVPFAYGLSDLLEGVPPEFILEWLPGYFINPACFWLAYQLIGRSPDFRRSGTWVRYGIFVAIFMAIEPLLWGFICAGQYTPEISYRSIAPALVFTTGITWMMAPVAMLVAYPVARRLGLFWAAIDGHVWERALGRREWTWKSGTDARPAMEPGALGLPIRMYMLAPIVALVLGLVTATAYVTMRSAEAGAEVLATKLHESISANVAQRIDSHLAQTPGDGAAAGAAALNRELASLPVAGYGLVVIVNRADAIVGGTAPGGDPVAALAVGGRPGDARLYRFAHITARPLQRERWTARASAYRRPERGIDWDVVTAIPEGVFLDGFQTASARSALVFSAALLLSLGFAGWLSSKVGAPLAQLSEAAGTLARGELTTRVPRSHLRELDALAQSFNEMASRLQASFAALATSENRLQLAAQSAGLGIWDWDIVNNHLLWDESLYQLYGVRKEAFTGTMAAWSARVLAEDLPSTQAEVEAALKGEREFSAEFRIRRDDGAIRVLKGVARTLRDDAGTPLRMVGLNWDVTDQLANERELRAHRDRLNDLVAERTAELSVAVSRAEAAYEQLRALESLRDNLVQMVVHDMRSPLMVLMANLQFVGEAAASLGPEAAEDLRGAVDAVAALTRMANDLLDVSRLEEGRMPLDRTACDLMALAAGVRDVLTRVDRGRVLTLEGEPGTCCDCDSRLVRRVIENLVTNAIKHTPAEGRICIRLALVPGAVRVTVEDEGPGVPENARQRVFEKFETGESKLAKPYHSAGLGLTFCKLAIEAHGGRIGVDAAPVRGSVFWFELPAVAPGSRQRLSTRT